jgi:uncharacterized membrane-anchored protein YitT (DUF2179 family)
MSSRNKWIRLGRDYLLLTFGALVVAAGVDMFMTPNHVVVAGTTGLGMIAFYLFKWPVGLTNLVLNIPLLAAGVRWGGGRRFLIRTSYAVLVMSFSIDLMVPVLPQIKGDPLIFTLFGGILDGFGVGLVLRAQGTTGGTDIVAQVLYRLRRIPFGQVFLVSNVLILIVAIPVVGLVPILYAVIVTVISSRVVDAVQEGLGYARTITIVSDRAEQLREAVFSEMNRGVTVLKGSGGYTRLPRSVLYVVVSRTQLTRVKRLIARIDPKAFVVVTQAHEVWGEGFRTVEPHPKQAASG